MTLVLLHPIGLDRECWSFLGRSEWQAMDLPGFGTSTRIGGVTLASAAAAVAADLPDGVDLVGASLGGIVASYVALQYPHKVRSLVIACTTASLDRDVMLARATSTISMPEQEFVADTLGRWFGPFQSLAGTAAGVAYARRRLVEADRDVMSDYWIAMADHDTRDDLGGLHVPTTVLGGYQDTAAPVDQVIDMAIRLPISRVELIPGPHMTQLTFPAQFSRCVDAHVQWTESL